MQQTLHPLVEDGAEVGPHEFALLRGLKLKTIALLCTFVLSSLFIYIEPMRSGPDRAHARITCRYFPINNVRVGSKLCFQIIFQYSLTCIVKPNISAVVRVRGY